MSDLLETDFGVCDAKQTALGINWLIGYYIIIIVCAGILLNFSILFFFPRWITFPSIVNAFYAPKYNSISMQIKYFLFRVKFLKKVYLIILCICA
jgi:hypothetical protein